jgi:hypothetical protein
MTISVALCILSLIDIDIVLPLFGKEKSVSGSSPDG